MGAGIANQFKKRYCHQEELKQQNVGIGGVARLKADDGRLIYYLVTKRHYRDKPMFESVGLALESLARACAKDSVKHLCIPTLACGLDSLEWNRVSTAITIAFKDTRIKISVYVL
jgi:hypothetical protein